MDMALLASLLTGGDGPSRLIGGLIIAILYLTIGFLGAIGSIFISSRVFQGRFEQIFWAFFLIMIAAFYLGFAAYFEASREAWRTELIGVVVFVGCAVAGLFVRSVLALGYVAHALWDLTHSLFGSSLADLSLTEIPLGYEIFCLTYDLTVALYIMRSGAAWREPGNFDFYFWRHTA